MKRLKTAAVPGLLITSILLYIDNTLNSAARVIRLKDRPIPRSLFGSQCKSLFDLSAFCDARRDIFAQRRAVFESVAGAASGEPDIVEIWMAVDQEIAVRSVFVLADARFDERGARQRRKPPGHKRARHLERVFGHLALGGVGVNRFAVTIEREFEASIFQVRHAVGFSAEVDPGRRQRRGESRFACGNAEKVNLLA